MDNGQWIRDGEQLPDGEAAAFLYVKGTDWQLYTTAAGGYALAVSGELYRKWIEKELLEEGYFFPLETDRFVFSTPAGEMISSVEYGPFPQNLERVQAFAKALKQTMSRSGISVGDGIYISRFGRILPTFQDRASGEADLILGRWICGGMNIYLRDSERMQKYAEWLPDSARESLLQMFHLTAMTESGNTILSMPSSMDPGKEKEEGAKESSNSSLRKPRAEGPFILRGRENLERYFREELLDVIDREKEYRQFGVGFPGPTLLYGPPGSGKTFAVEKLSEYLGWPVYRINSGTIGSQYVHETSRRISQVFDTAIRNAPSILIIDELEAFLSARESARGSYEIHMEEVDELLRRIPDAAENRVLLFGMTNIPDVLDKAALRKGRFDRILEVGMPSREEVFSVLEGLIADLPAEEGLNLFALADRLALSPLSDVSYVVSEAGRICVHEGKKRIDQKALEEACRHLKPMVRKKPRIGF